MPKVSALAAATLPLVGTETIYVVQGGNSRKSDVNAVTALVPAIVATTLNATGSAPMYACRAWVNFNGTGVVAIRASGNVSSITDNGVGDYTVNFTTAMQDVNYAVIGAGKLTDDAAVNPRIISYYSAAVGSIRIHTNTGTPALADAALISIAIFR